MASPTLATILAVVCVLVVIFGSRGADAAVALTDPMRPSRLQQNPKVVRSKPLTPKFELSSTLVSPGRRVAVINDRSVTVGDRIGGAKVLGIDTDRARLSYQGRTIAVHLTTRSLRRPVKPTDTER